MSAAITQLRLTPVLFELGSRLAAARARSDPAAFDCGLAEGQGWASDKAVAVGLAGAADSDAAPG